MEKLQASQILIKGAKLTPVKLDESDETIKELMNETRRRQDDIIKLKEVDEDRLRMIIKL